MRHYFLAGSCPQPMGSGTTLPSDDALLTYGACQGSSALANTGVYQDIAAGIEAGIEAGALVAGTAEVAVWGLTLIGADTFAATAGVAIAAAVPVIGWAVGIAVGIYEALNALGLNSCNFYVPKTGGGLEQIECSWYPQFVQNALGWLNDPANSNANMKSALTMSVAQFIDQHNIFASTDDQLYKDTNLLVSAQQYIQGLPTAYDMLRQIQLPAAAAVISAAPGLLNKLTQTTSTGQVPIQVQFPALSNNDVLALQSKFQGDYTDTVNVAKSFALTASNQPITMTTFASQLGISIEDAIVILASNNVPYRMFPGAIVVNGPNKVAVTQSSTVGKIATGTAVVGGVVGLGILAYKLYTGYTFAKTLHGLVTDVKHVGSKVKSEFQHHHSGRKSNPLDRSLATGGRRVQYRVMLSDNDYVLFENELAVLYRYDRRIAAFRPSTFQKTKIRAGRGELLIFRDQIEGK